MSRIDGETPGAAPVSTKRMLRVEEPMASGADVAQLDAKVKKFHHQAQSCVKLMLLT